MSLTNRFTSLKTKAQLKSRPPEFEEAKITGTNNTGTHTQPVGNSTAQVMSAGNNPQQIQGRSPAKPGKRGPGDVYSFQDGQDAEQVPKPKRRIQKKYIAPEHIAPDHVKEERETYVEYVYEDDDDIDQSRLTIAQPPGRRNSNIAQTHVVNMVPAEEEPPRGKPQQCDLCLKDFPSAEVFETHIIRVHHKTPMECDLCEILFASKVGYQAHVEKHKNETYYSCDVCPEGTVFTDRDDLEEHMDRLHKSYECEICDEDCINRKGLEKHAVKSHGGANPHHCHKCDQYFILRALMKDHKCRKKGEFICHLCERDFTHKLTLQKHLENHPKMLPCDMCDREFLFAKDLRSHMLTHELNCEHCGKMFKKRSAFDAHMEKHTGGGGGGDAPKGKKRKGLSKGETNPNIYCHVCGKTFRNHYHLKVHMRKHTGEKPYSCDRCSMRFSFAYQVGQHKKKKHTGESSGGSTTSEDTTGYQEEPDDSGYQRDDDVYLPDDDYPYQYRSSPLPVATKTKSKGRSSSSSAFTRHSTVADGDNVYYYNGPATTTSASNQQHSATSGIWSPGTEAQRLGLVAPATATTNAHDLRFGVPADDALYNSIQQQHQQIQTYTNPPVAHRASFYSQPSVQVQYNPATSGNFTWNNQEWSVANVPLGGASSITHHVPVTRQPATQFYHTNTGYQF